MEGNFCLFFVCLFGNVNKNKYKINIINLKYKNILKKESKNKRKNCIKYIKKKN